MGSIPPASGSTSPCLTGATKDATFMLFPKLPPEIRLRVWYYASFLPRDVDVFTVPMGIIDMGESSSTYSGNTFYAFRFVSSHPAPAIVHASREAREVGLKHYENLFGVHVEYEAFSFSTAHRIYYNPISDRLCFLGPVMFDAIEEIASCVQRYGARRLAINLQVVDNEGEHGTIDMLDQIDDWFHGRMDEIAIYSSHKRITKEDRFHFVDFDRAKINTKRGKALTKAKKRLEKQTAALVRSEEEDRADRRAALIKKCEDEGKPIPEPCACHKVKFRQPVVKLVSLVVDSAEGDH